MNDYSLKKEAKRRLSLEKIILYVGSSSGSMVQPWLNKTRCKIFSANFTIFTILLKNVSVRSEQSNDRKREAHKAKAEWVQVGENTDIFIKKACLNPTNKNYSNLEECAKKIRLFQHILLSEFEADQRHKKLLD